MKIDHRLIYLCVAFLYFLALVGGDRYVIYACLSLAHIMLVAFD